MKVPSKFKQEGVQASQASRSIVQIQPNQPKCVSYGARARSINLLPLVNSLRRGGHIETSRELFAQSDQEMDDSEDDDLRDSYADDVCSELCML